MAMLYLELVEDSCLFHKNSTGILWLCIYDHFIKIYVNTTFTYIFMEALILNSNNEIYE